MGNSQSIRNTLLNSINTNLVASIITKYAATTNSIIRANQSVKIILEDIKGDLSAIDSFNVNQRVTSLIDVNQLAKSSEFNNMVSDIQNTLSNEIMDKLKSLTAGFDLFTKSQYQELVNTIRNDVNTYVRREINSQSISEVLNSANFDQDGNFVLRGIDGSAFFKNTGNFNQDLQAEIYSKNVLDRVINNVVTDKAVNDITNQLQSEICKEDTGKIEDFLGAGGISTWIFFILGALGIAGGIVLAIILPASIPPKGKIAAAVAGIVFGIAMIAVGIFQSTRKKTAAAVATGELCKNVPLRPNIPNGQKSLRYRPPF